VYAALRALARSAAATGGRPTLLLALAGVPLGPGLAAGHPGGAWAATGLGLRRTPRAMPLAASRTSRAVAAAACCWRMSRTLVYVSAVRTMDSL
jgi:hypothetical protein